MQNASTPASAERSVPPAVPPPASRRRIFKSFIGVTGAGVLSRLVSMATDVIAKRALGPGVIGVIAWNSAAISYALQLTNPGLQTVARREAARNPHRMSQLYATMLLLQVPPHLLIFVACVAVWLGGLRPDTPGLLLSLTASAGIVSALIARWILESTDRHVVLNAIQLAASAVTAVLAYFLVRRPDDAVLYIVLQSLSVAAIAIGILVIARRNRHVSIAQIVRSLKPDYAELRRLYSSAWPVSLSLLAYTVYINAATLILGITHSDLEVGFYSTASGLLALGTVPAAMLSNLYFASLARASALEDKNILAGTAWDFARAVLFVTAPFGLMGWVFGSEILVFIYGSAYAASGPYFEWMSLQLIPLSLNFGLSGIFLPLGYNRKLFYGVGVGACINVIFNLALTPLLGATGAMISLVVTEFALYPIWLRLRKDILPHGHMKLLMMLLPLVVIAMGTRTLSHYFPHAIGMFIFLMPMAMLSALLMLNRAIIRRLIGSRQAGPDEGPR
jgi:O-antigen/teichoic acid export membrane protein